ncbi:MAG: hypothetical protein QM704_06200 [Anaeromyxobacteraceae bacterium]
MKLGLPPIPELAGPLPLGAAALLALNDHLLKAAFPGAITGKLSDLAGCFVLPLFLSAALACATPWPRRRRLAIGAVVTAAAFAAVKLSAAAAGAVTAALDLATVPLLGASNRIVVDPTDLVALPLVLAAFAWGARRPELGAGVEFTGR